MYRLPFLRNVSKLSTAYPSGPRMIAQYSRSTR